VGWGVLLPIVDIPSFAFRMPACWYNQEPPPFACEPLGVSDVLSNILFADCHRHAAVHGARGVAAGWGVLLRGRYLEPGLHPLRALRAPTALHRPPVRPPCAKTFNRLMKTSFGLNQ
jgi:hypothetical protein